MPNRTYKLIELVGTSDKNFADAAANAVKKASQTLKGLAWFEVVEERGAIRDDGIEYQVKIKVAFRLMGDEELGGAGTGAPRRRGR